MLFKKMLMGYLDFGQFWKIRVFYFQGIFPFP
jgi:hypothetical protein